MDSDKLQINTIDRSLAIAKEIYHQVERGIYCEGELADIIDQVRWNIEETAFILDKEDLLISKSVIENSFIKCAAEYCKYFEKIKILTGYLLECYNKLSAFGMTTECEHVSMICFYIRQGIRSSEELNYILNEADWVTRKLGIIGTPDIGGDSLRESYYNSRTSREKLEMDLSEYIGVLERYRNMLERLLNDALPY